MLDGPRPAAQPYGLIRIVQVRNENVPGVFGALATAIGNAGANLGTIETVHISQHHVIRDLDVHVRDAGHLAATLDAIRSVRAVEIVEVRDEVLDAHRGGKIHMQSTSRIDSVAQLRRIYTPGVAEVCRRIAEDRGQAALYTGIRRSVAMVTDGSAILGLGSIGAVAGMPVMEGKAALLAELTGLSGVPILLDTTDVDAIVDTVRHVADTFGGIHLEDIAAPHCFEVTERLKAELEIPVMHDDQDGTAAVVYGALLNGCARAGIDLASATVGQIGLGAAGQAISRLIMHETGRAVMGVDLNADNLARHTASGGSEASLDQVMASCHIVIATTGVKNLIEPEMVRRGQVILALSNPDPEIAPQVALEQGAAAVGDGRTVNNLLGYPGIWLGALASEASTITPAMLTVAGATLAALTDDPAELLPDPLDIGVHRAVGYAVATAAIQTGIGRLTDWTEELEPAQP